MKKKEKRKIGDKSQNVSEIGSTVQGEKMLNDELYKMGGVEREFFCSCRAPNNGVYTCVNGGRFLHIIGLVFSAAVRCTYTNVNPATVVTQWGENV